MPSIALIETIHITIVIVFYVEALKNSEICNDMETFKRDLKDHKSNQFSLVALVF